MKDAKLLLAELEVLTLIPGLAGIEVMKGDPFRYLDQQLAPLGPDNVQYVEDVIKAYVKTEEEIRMERVERALQISLGLVKI